MKNDEFMNIQATVANRTGYVEIDEWCQELMDGARKALGGMGMVPPCVFVLCVDPKSKGDTLINLVPMQQLESTENIASLVKTISQKFRVYAYASVSEAWMAASVGKDYQYGDIAKSKERREVVMINVENKTMKRMVTMEIVRDEKGKPSFGKIDKFDDKNVAGRMVDILYSPEAVKGLN